MRMPNWPNLRIVWTSWSNYSMDLLLRSICLVSAKRLLVKTAIPIGHDQVTEVTGDVYYKGDVYSGIRPDPLRDSESRGAGLRAPFFSTSSRRLLQASSGTLSTGGIAGLSIAIPLIVLIIVAMVIWYLRKRYAKSPPPVNEFEAATTSNSHMTCPPTIGFNGSVKGFRSWMKSFWASSCTKPKDDLSMPTVGSEPGFRSWTKILWAPSCAKPKDGPSMSTVGSEPGFRSWMKSFWAPSCTKPKDDPSMPTVGSEPGFRSWTKILWAPSCAKPKDDPSMSTVGSKPGFQSWMKSFWTTSSAKPKVYLSSACEMEFWKLQAGTANFSEANLLGEGGSARVYRAKLDDGDFAAVKFITGGGRHALAEFQAEIDLMRQVRHPNLVSLLGYCNEGERRLLVYELMRNGSLEEQLYGPKQGTSLSWHRRIKIALDSARGLAYLHEHCVPPVVHRDFKASNILLDENLNAKISDFGLATPLAGLTHEESLQLVGTIGYVAPEFFSSGTLTEKSDVYAFGVTLLELLTGRKPIDHSLPLEQQSLVNWAAPQLTNRKMLPKLVASHVQEDRNLILKHLYQVAAVAALCVQKEPGYRPLIGDVVQSLVPLVPVELGGAMRSDSSKLSSCNSSRSSSHRQQQELLKTGCESFSFARDDFDPEPPEISSAEMQ